MKQILTMKKLLFLLILFSYSCGSHEREVPYSEKGCVEYQLYQNGIKITTKCLASDGIGGSFDGTYYDKTKESCK